MSQPLKLRCPAPDRALLGPGSSGDDLFNKRSGLFSADETARPAPTRIRGGWSAGGGRKAARPSGGAWGIGAEF